MTGATRCPRFAATSPIAPWSCRPKPARDAATPGPPPDASAAARARRLDALRARLAVDGAPVCCGAGAGNPGRTRTGARAPSRRPRTTSDTPYTEPAPWQRLPSAPLHRAGPLPGAPPRPPWITIAPPEATTSAGAVGHDRAVGWITSRAPLKPKAKRGGGSIRAGICCRGVDGSARGLPRAGDIAAMDQSSRRYHGGWKQT